MRTTSRALNEGWTFRQLDAEHIPNSDVASWHPAEVPGHVHLDLLRLGVIPDPFERMYERTVQWVDDADWAYRCRFDVSEEEIAGARHLLRFDGLDTVATVLLDGDFLATTDNMFVEHEVDVTGRLTAGTHELEVRFESAERIARERLDAAGLDEYRAPANAHLGLTPRSMVRKAQYHWGWDWGPRLRGCGIWRPVSLVRVPVARIVRHAWRVRFEPDGTAVVTVDVTTDGPDGDIDVHLHGHGTDVRATATTTANTASVDLVVADPQRWWCAGFGDQPLYQLSIRVEIDGEVADELDQRVGLREIALVREPDDAGESFGFTVNGVAIFVKGANWIPDDPFPARTTTGRVRTQLRMARDCGMNMIRIWGGGLYESTDFYDACDEFGLLVWQDFAYACGLYPEDDATVAAATAEATLAVRRLRNHTSLALWCGNNENEWLGSLGFYGSVPSILGERIAGETLPAVVAAEDPDRPYWRSSPWGDPADPSGDAAGDCHNWNVWHGQGDWVHFTESTARFVSEFGFSGPPDRLTLAGVLDPDDLGADTPAMRWHDKTSKGYDTYLDYIALHYPRPETYDDLIYFGQLNQADALRFGIEHYRRLWPHTQGTLAWQLNDCWPVQSWAWIDHALRPKAVWYAARRFHAPLLVSLWSGDDGRVRATVVNEEASARTGTLHLQGYDTGGTVVWDHDVEVDVAAGDNVEVFAGAVADDVVLVHATLDDAESTLLLAEPKDLDLRVPIVEFEVHERDDGDATVTLVADSPALSMMLWLDGVDATWSDNAFHLLPDAPRTIEVRAAAGVPIAERLRWRCLHARGEGGA